MKLVVVNGYPLSGKSLFVSYCLQHLGAYGQEISTVEFIKKIATNLGWNGEKTPHTRKFLSDLKRLLTEWDDIPWKETLKVIDDFHAKFDVYDMPTDRAVMFIHSREPEEISRFREELGAVSVLIRRASVSDNEQSNDSDANVEDINYDYVIENDGTEEELREKAHQFCEMILNENK